MEYGSTQHLNYTDFYVTKTTHTKYILDNVQCNESSSQAKYEDYVRNCYRK